MEQSALKGMKGDGLSIIIANNTEGHGFLQHVLLDFDLSGNPSTKPKNTKT